MSRRGGRRSDCVRCLQCNSIFYMLHGVCDQLLWYDAVTLVRGLWSMQRSKERIPRVTRAFSMHELGNVLSVMATGRVRGGQHYPWHWWHSDHFLSSRGSDVDCFLFSAVCAYSGASSCTLHHQSRSGDWGPLQGGGVGPFGAAVLAQVTAACKAISDLLYSGCKSVCACSCISSQGCLECELLAACKPVKCRWAEKLPHCTMLEYCMTPFLTWSLRVSAFLVEADSVLCQDSTSLLDTGNDPFLRKCKSSPVPT